MRKHFSLTLCCCFLSLNVRFTWRPCPQPCSDFWQDRRHLCTYKQWPGIAPQDGLWSAVIGILMGQTKLTSDRGGGGGGEGGSLLPVDSCLSFFLFCLSWWLHHHHLVLRLCLTCIGHFIDMRCFFHPTSWRDCVCVRVCVCVIYLSCLCFFCVTPVRLCGRTYRANASQFIFLYSCNAIWYFYYTPCIVSFSPLFIYFPCKYIFC